MARSEGLASPAPPPCLVVAVLAVTALLSAALAAAQQPADGSGWTIVTDLAAAGPGVEVTVAGGPQQPFARLPPRTLDPTLLSDFLPAFNVLQDVSPDGDNTFTDTADQYVATIHSAFVEGEGGLVYDAAGRAYHPSNFFFDRTNPLLPLPQHSVAQASASCEQYASLASVVQKYGHMYYHFVEEALPRVALLAASGRLTSDVKLLTWGQPYEYEFLEMLGVQRDQVVPYNASQVYCADRLLVPTPTPRITPPREGLLSVRHGLGVKTLPQAQRDLVIYVSRKDEPTRRVANEDALLAAIRAAFPQQQLVVYSGDMSAADTIQLFQRAKLVVGPHGAGLSHILFSAPGTTVVEFLFLADPPLMFWHTAAALGQTYWLLPVPQGYWMQEEMQVPVDEVIDILNAALLPQPASPPACIPGTYADSSDGAARCTACSAGSYASNPGSPACKRCAPGRAAAAAGSIACRTCQPGSYSAADGTACLACPDGTFSTLPGAWDVSQCLTAEQRRSQQEDQAASVQLLSKLSPVFADQRRRLIEQGGSGALTQADLCATQQLASALTGPYRGPYLAGTSAPINCTLTVAPPAFPGLVPSPPMAVVVASPAAAPAPPAVLVPSPPIAVIVASPAAAPAPPAVVLPPITVPTLPPILLAAPPAPPVTPMPELRVDDATLTSPPPAPTPAPALYPEKSKVVDNYVIILVCVLGGLLVLPLLAWLIRRCVLARQRRKAQSAGPAGAPMLAGQPYSVSNPTFQPGTASDGEKAPLQMM